MALCDDFDISHIYHTRHTFLDESFLPCCGASSGAMFLFLLILIFFTVAPILIFAETFYVLSSADAGKGETTEEIED